MSSILMAALAFFGASLAQLVSYLMSVRRDKKTKEATTESVLRAMISDLDYCSMYLLSSATNLVESDFQIGFSQIGRKYTAYAQNHFDVSNLIQTGIYHRYQKPIGFAEGLSNIYSEKESYTVNQTFVDEARTWARYASYLAAAIEEVVNTRAPGNIRDYSEYPQIQIDNRIASYKITSPKDLPLILEGNRNA